MRVLSEATNAIAEGEVMQLMNQHDALLSEENYFKVITQKTAKLFSAATEIGAILQNAAPAEQCAMATYGLHLGIAFQITDDLLDYQADSNLTGKNIGDDLSEGKITLPLIYAMQQASQHDAKLIQKAVQHANIASDALKNIPESAYRDALQKLVLFSANRNY